MKYLKNRSHEDTVQIIDYTRTGPPRLQSPLVGRRPMGHSLAVAASMRRPVVSRVFSSKLYVQPGADQRKAQGSRTSEPAFSSPGKLCRTARSRPGRTVFARAKRTLDGEDRSEEWRRRKRGRGSGAAPRAPYGRRRRTLCGIPTPSQTTAVRLPTGGASCFSSHDASPCRYAMLPFAPLWGPGPRCQLVFFL